MSYKGDNLGLLLVSKFKKNPWWVLFSLYTDSHSYKWYFWIPVHVFSVRDLIECSSSLFVWYWFSVAILIKHYLSNKTFYFTLQDQHGNSSGTGYSGKVKVEICGPDDVTEVPCFVGGSRTLDVALNNGTCYLNVSA